jgi:hypothetical protein
VLVSELVRLDFSWIQMCIVDKKKNDQRKSHEYFIVHQRQQLLSLLTDGSQLSTMSDNQIQKSFHENDGQQMRPFTVRLTSVRTNLVEHLLVTDVIDVWKISSVKAWAFVPNVK